MNPRVRDVVPLDNYRLQLTFTNDEKGVYDCSPLLELGVFRELQDVAYFRQVKEDKGTVIWPHEQDLCPDTLYEQSTRTTSPSQSEGARIRYAAESGSAYGSEKSPL